MRLPPIAERNSRRTSGPLLLRLSMVRLNEVSVHAVFVLTGPGSPADGFVVFMDVDFWVSVAAERLHYRLPSR